MFSAVRFMAFGYVIAVGLVAWLFPWPSGGAHHVALRWLASGTRLTDDLLTVPHARTLEDQLRLSREHARLLHHYLAQSVSEGEVVLPENVLVWPQIDAAQVVPVELEAEPIWTVMNAGSSVEIWVNDVLKTPAARVLAIVPGSKGSWVVFLARADVQPDSLGTPKVKPVLRVTALPQPHPMPRAFESRHDR